MKVLTPAERELKQAALTYYMKEIRANRMPCKECKRNLATDCIACPVCAWWSYVCAQCLSRAGKDIARRHVAQEHHGLPVPPA